MFKRIRTVKVKLGHMSRAIHWASDWKNHIMQNYESVNACPSLAFYGDVNCLYLVVSSKTMQGLDDFSEKRLLDEKLMELLRGSYEFIDDISNDVVAKDI